MRAKLPSGDGLWPAFWTLGNNISTVSWPACGEIDIFEMGSAGAIAQNETNKELTALNERLRSEVDELVATITALEDNVQERWLLIGGGLVLAGLILGAAIKARPRRSAWS